MTAPKSPQQVWITRALPGAAETAARVGALGFRPLVAPVLRVEPLDDVTIPDEGYGALAFTSANAVRAFSAVSLDRRSPVFAVGVASARAARDLGFLQVASADGDVSALGRLIIAQRDTFHGAVLHPCALDPAGDLTGSLMTNGLAATAIAIYRTCVVRSPAPSVTSALQNQDLRAVVLHSPKAAQAVGALVPSEPNSALLKEVTCIALSAACAEPLAGTSFRAVIVARTSTEDDLLRALAES